MSPMLVAYEQDCKASRRAAPDLALCLNAANTQLGHAPDPVFAKVNQKIIELLDIDARQGEHAYHNRHHVGDVLMAVVLLCKQMDFDLTAPRARRVECMITAALGHDLHHDGRGTGQGVDVERGSATAVLTIARNAGLPAADLALIESLILATYPPVQLTLRQKLAAPQAPDPEDVLTLVFGEADVLASLTPSFGLALSVALSAEWRKAGLTFPSMPDEPAGREKFLGSYRLLTPSARRLGVDMMVIDQLQHLKRNIS
ncbi:MAG: hypothetical protein WCO04_03855 [Pseudomonadota bacterium]